MNDKETIEKLLEQFKNSKAIKIEEKEDGSITFSVDNSIGDDNNTKNGNDNKE